MVAFFIRVLLLAVERKSLVLSSLREHVVISLLACLFIALCGVPLGILIARFRRVAFWVIATTGVLYTIPALALFGFMIPLFGIGLRPTLFALFIYGLLPLVRNTYVGITTVDPAIVEAAKGMGSTDWQLLWRVQIPLALPVIVAGLRTVVVMTISYGHPLPPSSVRGVWGCSSSVASPLTIPSSSCLGVSWSLHLPLGLMGCSLSLKGGS